MMKENWERKLFYLLTPALMGDPFMVYQQSIGSTQVEAFSAGPKANHRGTFAYAVAEQKKWFDSLLTR